MKIRIALCQANTTIGAFEANADKALNFLHKAGEEGASLAIFPELFLSSYPPLDLLDQPEFVRANAEALERLAVNVKAMKNAPKTVVLGTFIENPVREGRPVQNAVAVIEDGRIVFTQAKRLLPTYDVFDEARYFQAGDASRLHPSPVGKLGLCVCEDSWFEDEHLGRIIYRQDPARDLRGADFIINTSASPFDINKRERRREMFSGFVKRAGAPMVFVNLVGGNDDILFDGRSAVYGKDGTVLVELPAFREGVGLVDFDPLSSTVSSSKFLSLEKGTWQVSAPAPQATSRDSEPAVLREALVTGIRDYFQKSGFTKAVLGLSGGIDSAVVACLAAEALGPRNVLGLAMPSQYSSGHSISDAEALAKSLGIEFRVQPIKFLLSTILLELKPVFAGAPADFTEENIQARLRAVIVMAMANKRGALVLSTGNKSELGVGYCTMYGDMAGAIAPLGDVYKTRVYELARYINSIKPVIPESTLTKAPSAELRPNQTDQDTLPPYATLDKILELHIEGLKCRDEIIKAGFDGTMVDQVLNMVRGAEFKRRQAAMVLRVTNKAFGLGRRIPVAKARWSKHAK